MGVSFLCVFDLKVAVFFPKIGVLGVVPLSVCRFARFISGIFRATKRGDMRWPKPHVGSTIHTLHLHVAMWGVDG